MHCRQPIENVVKIIPKIQGPFWGKPPACRLLFSLFNCISKIYRGIKRDCLVTVALPSSIDIRRCLSMVSMSI